jgi:hypothetical protein
VNKIKQQYEGGKLIQQIVEVLEHAVFHCCLENTTRVGFFAVEMSGLVPHNIIPEE